MTASPCFYLEIGPLKEREYTGISQVTAALAAEALGDAQRDVAFFFGRAVVSRTVVEDLLHRRDGELLEWHLQRSSPASAPERLDRANIAIFPNRKTCRRGFAREYQIIHDLSTLLTPHFHHQDTIDYHAPTMEDDILTNAVTFCVSDATRDDVIAYFPAVDPARVVSVPIAVGVSASALPPSAPWQSAPWPSAPWPSACIPPDDGRAGNSDAGNKVEPYILVLGTIEPRKNIGQVLDSIARNPAILQRFRFIFPGRFGWGDTLDNILRGAGLQQEVASGRLVFPGFVTDAARDALIRHARLLIYPSLFEGFGLPVLEAAAMGVPSIITRSSSLPQVGGPCAYYFDPFTEGDFERALQHATQEVEADRPRIAADCIAWSRQFSWERSYRRMMRTIEDDLRGNGA